jgi:hypothetical protein
VLRLGGEIARPDDAIIFDTGEIFIAREPFIPLAHPATRHVKLLSDLLGRKSCPVTDIAKAC